MKTILLNTAFLLMAVFAAQAAPAPTLAPAERARLEALRVSLRAQTAAKADDADAWLRLGRVEQALGEAEAARDAYKESVRFGPADAGAWSLLALAHEKLEEFRLAASAWEVCLAKTKDPALAAVARKHLKHLRSL